MTPEEAEEILEDGCADAVVIGRQLIADPWWVKKAWEGRSEDIVPCIRCMNCYNPYQYKTEEERKKACRAQYSSVLLGESEIFA